MLHAEEPSMDLEVAVHGEVESAAHEQQAEACPRRVLHVLAALEGRRHRTVNYPDALAQVHALSVDTLGAAPAQLSPFVRDPEIAPGPLGVAVVVFVHRAAILHQLLEPVHFRLLRTDGGLDGVVPALDLGLATSPQDVLLRERHLRAHLDHAISKQGDVASVREVQGAAIKPSGRLPDAQDAPAQDEVLPLASVLVDEPTPPLRQRVANVRTSCVRHDTALLGAAMR
mmetsp:Transcript_107142/g.277113  ORF Transcript_107142/g.277113 Transcript_107142/m.277113 type:complete len:228 (+) Transcript_107142:2298-2981(+)